jgi:hypothetical protein
LQLRTLGERDSQRTKSLDELRNKVVELTAKNAALEERSRNQEKTSDRGSQRWLAALGFGFGLLSLLVTAARNSGSSTFAEQLRILRRAWPSTPGWARNAVLDPHHEGLT